MRAIAHFALSVKKWVNEKGNALIAHNSAYPFILFYLSIDIINLNKSRRDFDFKNKLGFQSVVYIAAG